MKNLHTLPSVNPKSSRHIHAQPSFKVRPTLRSKGKENSSSQKSLIAAKAKAYLNKTKIFDSPQLIFALNDSIRKQTRAIQSNFHRFRDHDFTNKTIHHSPLENSLLQEEKQTKIFDFTSGRSTKGFYSLNKEREKAIELASWVQQKLKKLHNKEDGVTLQDIIDYKQTVISYGLGEIIQTVTKRCKEEGITLKFIWDATFTLFENLLNVLSQELRDKNKEMEENEEEMNCIYLKNIESLKKKNKEHQTHMEMLYQKMAKVIKWNRLLKKQRGKQELQKKVLSYQLQSFASALEEATQMLLTESKQPNCLNLAKKIISKLQREKKSKIVKNLKTEAKQKVCESAKEYVLAWLRKYSFEDEDKLKEAVNLTSDEKFELMQMDEEGKDVASIYDYFKNYEIGVQVKPEMSSLYTQYEDSMMAPHHKTIGIGTKKIYTNSTYVQTNAVNFKEQKTLPQDNGRRASKTFSPIQNIRRRSVVQSHAKIAKELVPRRSSGVVKNKEPQQGILKLPKKNNNSRFQKDISKQNVQQFPDVKEQSCQKSSKSSNSSESCLENKSNSQQLLGKSQNTMKSFYEWECENSRTDKFELSDIQRRNSLDKIPNGNNKALKHKQSYRGSQKDLSQCRLNYEMLPLLKQTFEQAYKSQLKDELTHKKQEVITNVVRRRSFYMGKGKKFDRQMIGYLYKPGRALTFVFRNPLNTYEQKIQNFFKYLNRKNYVNLNQNMAKNQQYAKNLFTNISSALKPAPVSSLPKNKNYVNLSVSGMTKFISKLLFDYLRRIKCEKDKILMEVQKVYFPLSVIMIDQMTHKYGLREIAEKKLRDFMQKLNAFVSASQRIQLFHKLLGIQPSDSRIGSEELLIYMKCIVYFDISKTIPTLAAGKDKDFSIERVTTNKEVVLLQLNAILNEFFPIEEDADRVRKMIEAELAKKNPQTQIDVQRISFILIQEFAKIKSEQNQQYSLLWRNCQGNFFTNFYKLLQIYGVESQEISKILTEAIKQADAIDEYYGKTMSEIKFVGFCCKMKVPKFSDIKNNLNSLLKQVFITLGIDSLNAQQKQEKINALMEQKNIRIHLQKDAPDYNLIKLSQTTLELTQIHLEKVLGSLETISKGIQSFFWKKA